MIDARNPTAPEAHRLDHVAIAVVEIDEALARFSLLGLALRSRELVADQKTEAALLAGGGCDVELIAPRGNEGLARFLDKRGPGLHHIAIRVDDLAAALARLEAAGVPLIDRAPRAGARGHRVAFLHPKAFGGVLVELVEHGAG